MSIVSLSTGEPTCTSEDLKAISQANNFTIEPGSVNETAFLLFANSFDAVCDTINRLPEYEDPRLKPCAVEGGERQYYRPDRDENPLNAWAHKSTLKSSNPSAANGPIKGKTVAFKDNISVGGLPLGLGASSSLLAGGKHSISPIDATVVKRVLEAGGIVKGTATCENFSMFALSYTSDSGVVHNAWLPGYATGGSSSGCGALVSIDDVTESRKTGKDNRRYDIGEGVDLGLGGDQGGSIRLPAAYSGIYGLKPTHGLVPYTGIASLNPMIDHVGPMTRTVEDCALLLGVLAGYDGIDFRMTPETPLRSQVPDYIGDLKAWVASKESKAEWTSSTAAKGLRVGILKESFELAGLDQEVISTVMTAAERFRSLGADVQDISIALHLHGAAIWTIAARPMMPDCVAGKAPSLLSYPMPHYDPVPINQNFFDTLANRNPATVNALMNSAHMERKYGHSLGKKAMMHSLELQAAYDKAFENVDVLLTPVNPTVGPKHPSGTAKTRENPNGFSERIMDLFEPAIGNTSNTCSFNVTGHPAMSIPIGWGKVKEGDGRLPIGMQLVAKRWDEASIFKAAKAWEMGGRWQDS
jgi:amidase